MLKVKSLKSSGNKAQLRFSEWSKSDDFAPGKYVVKRIFGPRQYPTAAVVFETEKYAVKLVLSADMWKMFAREYQLQAKDMKGKVFYVIVNDLQTYRGRGNAKNDKRYNGLTNLQTYIGIDNTQNLNDL